MRIRELAVPFVAVALVGGAAIAPAEAAAPPTTGWVLGYGFESVAGGVVTDASPSGFTGVLRGTSPAVLAPSKTGHGQAISFDSAKQQFVDVPDNAALDVNTYTVTAWVRYLPNVHDDRWEVVEKAGAYWMNIRTDTRKLRVGGFYGGCLNPNWHYVDSVKTIPAKTWVHVASTYDGTRLRLYVNGVLDTSLAVSGRTCASTEPLTIGAKNKTSAGTVEAYFDGRIDDFRVYNRALTATQIKDVRAAATP